MMRNSDDDDDDFDDELPPRRVLALEDAEITDELSKYVIADCDAGESDKAAEGCAAAGRARILELRQSVADVLSAGPAAF